MRRLRLFEEFTYNESGAAVVYHGSDDEHDFAGRGRLFNGTFFSSSSNEAKRYGGKLYRVELRPDLRLLDTNKLKDCQLIIDEFGPLEDPYYREDEPEFIIDDAEKLWHHSDSWSPLESNDQLMSWIEGNYDGVWVYEGGARNLLLFDPVVEKIHKKTKIG